MLHKNGRNENCSQKIVSSLIYYTHLDLTFTVKTAMKFTTRGKSLRNLRPTGGTQEKKSKFFLKEKILNFFVAKYTHFPYKFFLAPLCAQEYL